MYHLVLLMPIIGLIVFWIWPLSIALPVYAAILIVSGLLWAVLLKAMHRPVTTGEESMIGQAVTVLDTSEQDHVGHVRIRGAIWRITAETTLHRGDKVQIIGVDGLTLKVAPPPETTR